MGSVYKGKMYVTMTNAFRHSSPLFSGWEYKNIWEYFIPFFLSEKYLFFFYIWVGEEKNDSAGVKIYSFF